MPRARSVAILSTWGSPVADTDQSTDATVNANPVKKKGGVFGKHTALIAGAGVVVLVVLYFLLKGNSSSSTTAAGTSTSTTDPATGYPYGSPADVAALNGSGMYQPYPQQGAGVSGSGYGSTTTNNTTTNNTTNTSNLPGYGQAGTSNNSFQAIPSNIASILASNHNTFNPAGDKSQRPYIWNGSSYVPATNITAGYQYYSGPLETKEINGTNTKAAKK